MESVVEIFVEWGYIGLFISAFVAGSIVPFSSEIVLTALVEMGADPAACILSASVGNALGGMFCYWLGYIGNLEKIEKWLKIDQTKIHKFSDFVQRRGSWIGIFGFLPWVGEVILVLLGLMRTNVWTTSVFVFVGKLMRYVVWYVGVDTLLSLFA